MMMLAQRPRSWPNAYARFQLAGSVGEPGEPPPPPERDNVITDQLDDVVTDDGDVVVIDG